MGHNRGLKLSEAGFAKVLAMTFLLYVLHIDLPPTC